MFFYQVDLLGGKGRQHVRVLRGLRGAEQMEIGEDEDHSDHSDEGGDVAKVASVGKVKSPLTPHLQKNLLFHIFQRSNFSNPDAWVLWSVGSAWGDWHRHQVPFLLLTCYPAILLSCHPAIQFPLHLSLL